jgi:hypothetical protein
VQVALGFFFIIVILVGLFFLAKWAFQGLGWLRRRLFGEREDAPKGLGSQYEAHVRQHGSAVSAPSPAPVVSVTPDHYERSLGVPALPPRRPVEFPAPSPSSRPALSVVDRKAVDRLQQLDELKRAGLVSDDEYHGKRAEVLSEL